MVTITLDPKGGTLAAEGHAGHAPKGADIVCAAVSAIMYTADAALRCAYTEGKLAKPHNKSERDGRMRLTWTESDYASDMVSKIAEGLREVSKAYPESVKFKKIL